MSTGPESPLADPQQIQGNILRPFGGQCQAFLFLSFRNDRAAARRWLAAAAGRVAGTDDVGAVRDGWGERARVPRDTARGCGRHCPPRLSPVLRRRTSARW
jgi:hypothetical protein